MTGLSSVERVMVRWLPEPVLQPLVRWRHGNKALTSALRRGLRRHLHGAAVATRFDAEQVRRETAELVQAALTRHDVDFVAIPGARAAVASLAVSTDDRPAAWRALATELAGSEWVFGPNVSESSADPARRIRRARTRKRSRRAAATKASSVCLYRTVVAPDGQQLAGAELGCDLEFWRAVGKKAVPRADGGHFEAGTYLAPRPNDVAAYLTADAWRTALDAPNHWIRPRPMRTAFQFEQPVDLVYTWVDGLDPEWQERKWSFGVDSPDEERNDSSDHVSRYYSRDELRYSLRSVAMFASWARRIFIVTDGQVPDWLDTSHPKITMVEHKEIFSDPSVLPVFNSHAIESQLHHIPGLAEHYLYLNDDFFFGRPVSPENFYHANGIAKFFLSKATLDLGPASRLDLPVLSAAKRNRDLLEREFDFTVTRKFRHTPQPQLRSVVEELERRHPEIFANVARSRFRHPDDYSIPSALVHYFAFGIGRAVPDRIDYRYQDIAMPNTQRWLDRLLRQRNADVFCLNDHVSDPRALKAQGVMIARFLERYFPVMSEFEIR